MFQLRDKDVQRGDEVAAEESREAQGEECAAIAGNKRAHFGQEAEVVVIERVFAMYQSPCRFNHPLYVTLPAQAFEAGDQVVQRKFPIVFLSGKSGGLRDNFTFFVDHRDRHHAE